MLKRKYLRLIFPLIILFAAVIACLLMVQGTKEFQIADGVLVKYRGKEEHILVPAEVKEIGRLAFQDCDTIVSVEIPEGVECIGEGAFANCSNLRTVVIPESVKTIEMRAFAYDFSLESVSLPEELDGISTELFYGCKSLEEIELGSNIRGIGDYAFYQCETLETVSIPDGTAGIGNSAFSGCKNLQTVTLPSYNLDMGTNVFANCISLREITLPKNLKYINNGLFWNCTALQSIEIPAKVTSVGDRAFYRCESLAVCDFPGKLTWIGNEAFYGCIGLKTISLPQTKYLPTAPEESPYVKKYAVGCTIGADSFAKCTALNDVTIPAHVNISSTSFFGCTSLTRLAVDPAHLQYIVVDGVLYSSARDSLILYPAGLTQRRFTIPDEVQVIEERAFSGNENIWHITAGRSLREVRVGAFFSCAGLRGADLNQALEYIAADAFKDCADLERFDLPAGCYMETNALRDCTALQEIEVNPQNRSFFSSDGVLFDYAQSRLLLYPPQKTDSSYTIPETVTAISEYAFADNTHLQELVIPEKVNTIERRALSGCTQLRSIAMSDSVEVMASEIFYGIEDSVQLTVYAERENCIPIIYADNVGVRYEWVKREK